MRIRIILEGFENKMSTKNVWDHFLKGNNLYFEKT